MKSLLKKVLLVAVLALLLAVIVYQWASRAASPLSAFEPRIDEKAVLSVLATEDMAFLVTRRTTTQIVIQHSESDFFGDWEGVMWATVRWNWGVDLHELTEKDLRREGDTIICRLPEPKLLEYCITDPADIHYMTKATAIPKVRDWFAGQWFQHTLEARMRPTCERFAKDHGLKPSRAEIARQLNGLAALFQAKAGVKLRFE